MFIIISEKEYFVTNHLQWRYLRSQLCDDIKHLSTFPPNSNEECSKTAVSIFIALEKADAKSVVTVAWTSLPGFSIATAISVMKTAPTMEMKARNISKSSGCSISLHLHAMDMYETFFSVLGRERIKKTLSPTIPHTMVQVAWPVIALKAIVKVAAISLNRGEVNGAMSRPAGTRPGWDIAGTIERAAADGSGPTVGTRVVGFIPTGNYERHPTVPDGASEAMQTS